MKRALARYLGATALMLAASLTSAVLLHVANLRAVQRRHHKEKQ